MSRRQIAIGGGVVAIVVVWLLWPSKYSRVANLDSRGTNIIAFGDSLTAGYGASAGEDYPSRLSALIGTTVKPSISQPASGVTSNGSAVRLT